MLSAWTQSAAGRVRLALALLVLIIACDQLTKVWATRTLAESEPWIFADDVLRLQYALNPGGFLGLGGDLAPAPRAALFIGINGLGLAALAGVMIWRKFTGAAFAAGCLILAGGIGNQIDRCLWNGFVIDFMNLGLGPIRTGIFNVADIAISVGVVIWCWMVVTQPETNSSPVAHPFPHTTEALNTTRSAA